MSDKFEQKIFEWCNKSQTRNLEYLDLSRNPSIYEVASNLSVTHTKVCYLTKAVFDNFSQILEENRRLRKEVSQLKGSLSNLEKEVYNQKNLTKRELVEVVNQPRVIDEEAIKASGEILVEVRRLQKSVLSIKKLISGE